MDLLSINYESSTQASRGFDQLVRTRRVYSAPANNRIESNRDQDRLESYVGGHRTTPEPLPNPRKSARGSTVATAEPAGIPARTRQRDPGIGRRLEQPACCRTTEGLPEYIVGYPGRRARMADLW